MEYKFFDKPKCHDFEFYKNRKGTPHIDKSTGALRFYLIEGMIAYYVRFKHLRSMLDLGCGDGGLIQLLAKRFPTISFLGYDLCPANIEGAKIRLKESPNSKVEFQDFTKIELPEVDLVIMTEVLEHLIEPKVILKKIKSRFIVVSCPLRENCSHYDKIHLWAWDKDGFLKLFQDSGWKVEFYIEGKKSKFIMASRVI